MPGDRGHRRRGRPTEADHCPLRVLGGHDYSPSIDSTLSPYEPQITSAEQVDAEVDRFASLFEEYTTDNVLFAPVRSTAEQWLELLGRAELRDGYAKMLPLVHRFLIAELDCVAPSERGFGRLSDEHPPPRAGARFRLDLQRPGARERLGLVAEQETMMGFVRRAVRVGRPPGERELEELWGGALAWLITTSDRVPDVKQLVGPSGPTPLGYLHAQLGGITGQEMTDVCEEIGLTNGWQTEEEMQLAAEASEVTRMPDRFGRALYEQSIAAAVALLPPPARDLVEDYTQPRTNAELDELVRLSRAAWRDRN